MSSSIEKSVEPPDSKIRPADENRKDGLPMVTVDQVIPSLKKY